ncbi:variable surface lipoprotein [[Mycoplasma] phocae]|uniref:variable surface lipoprotein n=1 Tax=[Mycoplasma] phocae TaxID=142651 RepID=UPI001476280B|nr:variable surface lipoprotein [[Mycoplasma] phocae]
MWIALPITIATLPLIAAACDQNNKKTKPITKGVEESKQRDKKYYILYFSTR